MYRWQQYVNDHGQLEIKVGIIYKVASPFPFDFCRRLVGFWSEYDND